jgi:hypothetical protein
MSKASATSLLVLCAALAGCTDGDTNRTLTAPDARPALSEAPAGLRGGVAMDGPFDLAFASEGASMQQAAAAPQAATGGRASGHVALSFSPPFLNLVSEEYSFVALRTDPLTPFAAKGQYDMTLTSATGAVQEFHGDVICMSTVGNTTRIAGQLTEVVVNGIPRPINPNASHNIWTVTDNGEGTPDTVSIMIFFPALGAQYHCATGFTPPAFPNQAGNVQVQP